MHFILFFKNNKKNVLTEQEGFSNLFALHSLFACTDKKGVKVDLCVNGDIKPMYVVNHLSEMDVNVICVEEKPWSTDCTGCLLISSAFSHHSSASEFLQQHFL